MLSHLQYKALVVEVNRLRNEIHLFNNEEISEAALDDLKHKITQFETLYPDLIDPNSPNSYVSGGVAKGFSKFEHERRMLSLNDIFDFDELNDWELRWKDYATKSGIKIDLCNSYICEPKIDGLALSLIYENGQLVRAVTRGDGFVGEDVTANIKQIKMIPATVTDIRKFEVRGEVFMTKTDFEDLNKSVLQGSKVGKMSKTGIEGQFANPRNVASGTIRQLDSSIVADRNLSFIAYNVYVFETEADELF